MLWTPTWAMAAAWAAVKNSLGRRQIGQSIALEYVTTRSRANATSSTLLLRTTALIW